MAEPTLTRYALWVSEGPAAGSTIELDRELVLGRSSGSPGSLEGDEELSRRHARIAVSADGSLTVEDLGSMNGTLVGGRRVRGVERLEAGSSIQIGRSRLEVQVAGGTSPENRTTARHQADPGPGPRAREGATPHEQVGSPSALLDLSELVPAGSGVPPGDLIFAAQRIPVPRGGATIGSGPDADVRLEGADVAPRHARVIASQGRHYLADLGEGAGTELNGELLQGESRWLNSGDTITAGGERVRYLAGQQTAFTERDELSTGAPRQVALSGNRLTIGRDGSNGLVLDDPNVSRFHAEIIRTSGGAEVRDLGSRNGLRVNGQKVSRGPLAPGSEVGVGPFRLVFDGENFIRRDDRGAMRVRVRELVVEIKGKRILNRASLAVEPGEFVVIIGESGAGKSTLVKALAGVNPVGGGEITLNGESHLDRLTDIGYVPQDEIVHRHLTTVEALRYAARLRLPADTSEADVDSAIERVVDELSLEEHKDTLIGSLSGGQRKRAGMATELLSRPSVLLLDEPTTGLDPGLETRMMELFRDLSEEGVRSVIVVTHATKNLGLADKVVVMGRGGEPAFIGPPKDALRFFGVADFDGIYSALDDRSAVEWRRDFEAANPGLHEAQGASQPRPGRRAERPRVGLQAGTLMRRYFKLMHRDRRNLLILLAQAPVIGLAVAIVFKGDVLGAPGVGDPRDASQLVFLLVTSAIWLGSIDGSREIIKERGLAEREAAVGVSWTAYLISKAVVLFGIAGLQCVLAIAVVFLLRPPDAPLTVVAIMTGLIALTSCVAVGTGLLVSASVGSEDQATSFIPLVLIPQLLFAGALVAIDRLSDPVALLSNLVFARWSYAVVGSEFDLNARIDGDPAFAVVSPYGPDFFALSIPVGIAILLAFMVIFFGFTAAQLQRSRG